MSRQSSSVFVPGGLRELSQIALPLVLSTASLSLMHVVDRVFLSRYSEEAMAGSMPAGAASFVFISLFMGTAGYVNTFVSQYDGAGRPYRIGVAVWQGVWLSVVSSILLAGASFLGGPIFHLAGHHPLIIKEEIIFFHVLTLGGGGEVFCAALSAYYSGRGKTWLIMWVNLFAVVLTAVLDYGLIFGKFGLPEWGIFGAGVATVAASWCKVLTFICVIALSKESREHFAPGAWRPDWPLLTRIIRYGLPGGMHFTVDVLSWTLFMLLIGRLGQVELAATTVAFTINGLVFVPMIGLAMATSVLVGRYQGAEQPDNASRATHAALAVALTWMGLAALILILAPDFFLHRFGPHSSPESFEEVYKLGRVMVYFIAAYTLFDACCLVYSAALKGAGDTRYVFQMLLLMASTLLCLPTFLLVYWRFDAIWCWWVITGYIAALSIAYATRFYGGKWRSMRVIEATPAPVAAWVEGPAVETMPVESAEQE